MPNRDNPPVKLSELIEVVDELATVVEELARLVDYWDPYNRAQNIAKKAHELAERKDD